MKQYLSLILFLFLLAACDSSDAPEATGYGYINLNIGTNPEISVATTRAGDTDTDVSTYLITIKSGTTTYLSQKPYSIIQSTPLRFEAGTYSIIAESCISTDAESANDRWGKARYYGSQDITVVTSQTVNADIICTMQKENGLWLVGNSIKPSKTSSARTLKCRIVSPSTGKGVKNGF